MRSILVFSLFLAASSLRATDGARLAERCDDCHGPNGVSEDREVPAISGFAPYAILDLLESYRIRERKSRRHEGIDGRRTDMNEISADLTVIEAQVVADYYGRQRWVPKDQPFNRSLAKRGAKIHEIKCAGCHSDYGGDPDDELALLLGQWRDYLELEFDKFDKGTRPMPDKMGSKYKSLTAADKRALLELYASGGRF